MIDMYDLPTESELAQGLLESAKKQIKVNEIETKTIFPFWEPPSHSSKSAMVVSDKTGVVKPKDNFTASDVQTNWKNFLKSYKTVGAKPIDKLDSTTDKSFGSVIVGTYAQTPDSKKLVGSIKALKKTTVNEMSGKMTTKTEEIGVYKVLAKSNAAEPRKNSLVGIVQPVSKKSLENLAKKPKLVDVSGSKTVIGKEFLKTPKLWNDSFEKPGSAKGTGEKKGPAVVSDKTGVVKPPKSK